MQKPAFFISSTIYDFKDLRSSIKWWLEENNYTVNASEYNDFSKPLDENSYDACLRAIENSDYFILLIGDRLGGMYDNLITITQMEYRYAYQRMLVGKLKIVNFIRQETWQQFNDSKSRIKKLKSQTSLDSSNIVQLTGEDEKIKWAFIDEVRRVEEMKQGGQPKGNWLHRFDTFADVISVFRSELGSKPDLNFKQSRFIVLKDVVRNLQAISSKYKGEVYSIGFMRKELWTDFQMDPDKLNMTLTEEQYLDYGPFFVSCLQIKPMKASRIESFYRMGFFLNYDTETHDFVDGDLNRLASRLLTSYERLDSIHKTWYKDSGEMLLSLGKKSDNSHLKVRRMEIFLALEYYAEILNCMELSKNLYSALMGRKYLVPKPRGRYERMPEKMRPKPETIVTEADILALLNKKE